LFNHKCDIEWDNFQFGSVTRLETSQKGPLGLRAALKTTSVVFFIHYVEIKQQI